MNLYLRFIWQIIKSFCSSKISVESEDKVSMRVWPLDLDGNLHLNNGVFLSMMDLGRTRFSIRSGLFHRALKSKMGFGVVGGINITYLKSLAPFQKFTLKTRLGGYYKDWVYLEQRFESNDKLIAAALVKVIFLRKGKKVSIQNLSTLVGAENILESKPYLEKIFDSEKEFLAYIKKDYSA